MLPNELTKFIKSPEMEQALYIAKQKGFLTKDDMRSIYTSHNSIKQVLEYFIRNNILRITDIGFYKYVFEENLIKEKVEDEIRRQESTDMP